MRARTCDPMKPPPPVSATRTAILGGPVAPEDDRDRADEDLQIEEQ